MTATLPVFAAALFENLVEFAPDAMLVVNAAGKIILANRTAEALFGLNRDELLGAPIEQLIPNDCGSCTPAIGLSTPKTPVHAKWAR